MYIYIYTYMYVHTFINSKNVVTSDFPRFGSTLQVQQRRFGRALGPGGLGECSRFPTLPTLAPRLVTWFRFQQPPSLHVLMPCWNRRDALWAQLLPGWRVEAWSGERLSTLPVGPNKVALDTPWPRTSPQPPARPRSSVFGSRPPLPFQGHGDGCTAL